MNTSLPKALVVDNSKHTADAIEKYFETEGYVTCSAENGAGALNLCMTVRPEIVTLALDLSVMDGFELLKRIRKEFPEIKCIVISSLENMDVMEKCFRLGAAGFLVKPFTKEEFIGTVNNSLRLQAQGKLYHIFLRSASRLDNAMRRLIPNSTVSLTTLEMFPYEVPVKVNYQNTNYKLVSVPKIKETRTWSAPEGKTGFIDLLVGRAEGKIISFVSEDAISYLRNFEDVEDIEEFFDMVHAKIVSEIAESFEREIYLKRCGHFDVQIFEYPPTDMVKAEFAIKTDEKIINLDTFVWLPN